MVSWSQWQQKGRGAVKREIREPLPSVFWQLRLRRISWTRSWTLDGESWEVLFILRSSLVSPELSILTYIMNPHQQIDVRQGYELRVIFYWGKSTLHKSWNLNVMIHLPSYQILKGGEWKLHNQSYVQEMISGNTAAETKGGRKFARFPCLADFWVTKYYYKYKHKYKHKNKYKDEYMNKYR